jgi:sulfide:quinone oxidoreductase
VEVLPSLAPGGARQVVIAGGGFAALEAALALRALVGDHVRLGLSLISASKALAYRPAATAEAFTPAAPLAYGLPAIAAELGASFHHDRLVAVEPGARRVELSSGGSLEYDALVVATGARATPAIAGALTFRDQRDVPAFRAILRELEAGKLGRLVFAVPSGPSWPLPAYELALLSAARAQRRSVDTQVMLVSIERAPLAVFGERSSRQVNELLYERGVRFVGQSAAARLDDDGRLEMQFGSPITADRVVAVPRLRADPIGGLPGSWWGFVQTDSDGRVEGLSDVYAAGDVTTFPVKQGGIAAQQADQVAHTIARSLGVPVDRAPARSVLRATLLGGERPLLLRSELDADGKPAGEPAEAADADHEPAAMKVFSRFLTPYLDADTLADGLWASA